MCSTWECASLGLGLGLGLGFRVRVRVTWECASLGLGLGLGLSVQYMGVCLSWVRVRVECAVHGCSPASTTRATSYKYN